MQMTRLWVGSFVFWCTPQLAPHINCDLVVCLTQLPVWYEMPIHRLQDTSLNKHPISIWIRFSLNASRYHSP